jgi:spermidine/putrescine transport system permease protein
VTYFLTGRDNTLPMYIWSVVRRGITPEINAIGTIIVVFSMVLIFVSVLMIYDGRQDTPTGRRN